MKCPICACEEVAESRTRGIGKYLLPYSPLTRHRCLNCWYRFWAFRNLPLKIVYLFVLSALLILGGIRLYSHLVGPAPVKSESEQAAGPAPVRGVVAAVPPAVAEDSGTRPQERSAGPMADDGESSRGAAETAAPMEEKGIALHRRPDPESAVAAVIDRKHSYKVIHYDSGWVVLELPGGVVGWTPLDELTASPAIDADVAGKAPQAASPPPASAEAPPASTEETAAISPPPVETAPGPPAAMKSTVSDRARAGPERPADSEKSPAVSAGKEAPDTRVVGVDIGRVRSAPSVEAPIVFRILNGEVVHVVDLQDDWLKIRHNSGWSGWAHRSLFTIETPEALASGPKKAAEKERPSTEAAESFAASERRLAKTRPLPPEKESEKAPSSPAAHESVEREAARAPEPELTVTVQRGRVRSAPSLEAQVLFQIEKDQRFPLLDKKGDWFQLRVGDGPGGWAHASLFGAADSPATDVSTAPAAGKPAPAPDDSDALRDRETVRIVGVTVGLIRSAPSATAPVKFRLYGNEKVEAIESRGEWIRIRRINGWIGWGHESLFLPPGSPGGGGRPGADTAAQKTATVAVDVGLVREAPAPDADRVCRIVNRMKVAVLAQKEDWLNIRMINGWTGWAHKSLFRESGPQTGVEQSESNPPGGRSTTQPDN